MLSEMSVSILGPTTLGGRDVGSRCINVEFNLGETNPVGYKRRFSLKFNSNWNESIYGKERKLRNSDWIGEGLTVEVNREGKRRVAWNSYKSGLRSSKWVKRSQREHMVGPSSGSQFQKNPVVNKGGLRSFKWVTRSQREHVVGLSSGSWVQKNPVVGLDQDCNTQVGLLVIPILESTGPIRMEVGESPSLGDPRPLNHEAQASMMSNTPHEASIAQVVMLGHRDELMSEVDTTGAGGSHAEKSPVPLEKADIVRNQPLKTAMSLAGQTEMMGCPAKASVVT